MLVGEAGLDNCSILNITIKDEYIPEINENLNQVIYFRFYGQNFINKAPIMIPFDYDEKVSSLIAKLRNKCNLTEYVKFIFNAKSLNESLTVAEAGLTNNSNVFVVKTFGPIFKIDFKFWNLKENYIPINIEIGGLKPVSDLIKKFLKEIYLNGNGFQFIFNSKKLEEGLSIEKVGFLEKPEIYFKTERPIKVISLMIKFYNKEITVNVAVVINYYISTLIKIIENNFNLVIDELIFNNRQLETDLTIEEAGLKNNDIIYIKN